MIDLSVHKNTVHIEYQTVSCIPELVIEQEHEGLCPCLTFMFISTC